MDTIQQRRTSAAATGITKPPGAMNSAFDTGASPAPARAGHRNRLPSLDASKLELTKAPPPEHVGRCKPGQTKYDAVFDKLTHDGMGCTGIPKAYKAAIHKAGQTYAEHHPALKKSRLVVRNIDDDTVGVWRLPKQER